MSYTKEYFLRILVFSSVLILGACKSASPVTQSDPAPLVNLSVTTQAVAYNGQVVLSWSASNSNSCTASGAWSGSKAVSGGESVGPISTASVFSLQCAGSGGSASDSVSVTLLSPSLTLSADRSSVGEGESVDLSWSANSASGCVASGDWSGSKLVSGTQTIGPLASNSTFTLSCSNPDGSVSETVNVSVSGTPPPGPSLIFSASPTTVEYGGSSTLSWSATDATDCSASGGWSGPRSTSGSETKGPLVDETSYTLSCSGAGGSVTRSVTVSVEPPPEPVVLLSANPTSVANGGNSLLDWSSSSATSCIATGAWSGPRSTAGSEQVGPLSQTSVFTLTCTGPGGSASDSVSVVVTGGGSNSLSGVVDSSLIDRQGVNQVYVYAGNVAPDDFDGDAGDPMAVATVTQTAGSCGWTYALSTALAGGDYTVAFTADAGNDVPGQDDVLDFFGTTNITVDGGSAEQDFVPGNIVRVGPTRAYTTLAQASQAVSNGDVVEIDAGVYTDDISVWRADNVTLRGTGGFAHLQAIALIPYTPGNDQHNGMGIIVTRGNNMSIENIEFSGARVPDENGAGIRAQGGALSICNSYFHDNENGILGGGSTVLIEYSEFDNNGLGEYGRTHNIYIDNAQRLIFRFNYSHHANIGHNLKSRARENFVYYSRLMDEVSGTSSYAIDLPNGGLSYVIGNLLQQGPGGDNSIILNYGSEGLSGGATHHLYVVNNSFVNDRGTGTFVAITGGTQLAVAKNNLFVGGGNPVSGSAQQSNNLQTSAPGFVDIDNYDYRLTAGSPAVDAGVAPGSGDGVALTPDAHYVHKASSETRVQSGEIDIGAYEYLP